MHRSLSFAISREAKSYLVFSLAYCPGPAWPLRCLFTASHGQTQALLEYHTDCAGQAAEMLQLLAFRGHWQAL